MDYDIGHRKRRDDPLQYNTGISYDISIGGRYGKMPPEALVAKFEQTDMGNEEMVYENYVREQAMSWNTTDETGLESDAPRKNYASKGYLNLIHKGGRGDVNDPAHPEMFLELTDKEPRRTATDPDLRELRKQSEARMRFIKFHADADNSITGGGWDRLTGERAKKYLMTLLKPRMRIFSTSKDGRRNPMLRSYETPSAVATASDQKDYGERITTDSLNPQRKTTILSNTDIRSSKMYQANTTDHEFEVAKYGVNRSAVTLSNDDRIRAHTQEGVFGTENKSAVIKSAGLLMGDMVKMRGDLARMPMDNEYNDAVLTQDRKSQKIREDLSLILRDVAYEQIMGQAHGTQARKTGDLPGNSSIVSFTTADSVKPAHHYINAEIMYKSVNGNTDKRKATDKIITNDAKPAMEGEANMMRKTSMNLPATNSRESHIEVDGVSVEPHVYKTPAKQVGANASNVAKRNPMHAHFSHSDDTPIRSVNHENYKTTGTNKLQIDTQFQDNMSKERHGAPMGTKYLRREMRTEDNDDKRLENRTSA